MTHPQIHRHTITDGSHADLKKLVIRLPYQTSALLTARAAENGKSVSLYLAQLVARDVGERDG